VPSFCSLLSSWELLCELAVAAVNPFLDHDETMILHYVLVSGDGDARWSKLRKFWAMCRMVLLWCHSWNMPNCVLLGLENAVMLSLLTFAQVYWASTLIKYFIESCKYDTSFQKSKHNIIMSLKSGFIFCYK